MLTIPLARLEREGRLEIRSDLPPDDPCWEGTQLRFSIPLSVVGNAQQLSNGDILARLTVRGILAQECKRCLEGVEVVVEEEVDLLFAPAGESEEEGGVRPLPESGGVLDLTEAVREEVVLSQPLYAVCTPECKGFCPTCGVNLNQEDCQCPGREPDPRWEALRGLGEKQE